MAGSTGKSPRKKATKTKPKKKTVDMDALRVECQQFHGFIAGVIEDLIDRLYAIYSEMENENSPLRLIWDKGTVRSLYQELNEVTCSLCSMFVPIPPTVVTTVPDPVRLCAR